MNPIQLWWQQPGQRRPTAKWNIVQEDRGGGGSLSCLQGTKRQVMVVRGWVEGRSVTSRVEGSHQGLVKGSWALSGDHCGGDCVGHIYNCVCGG